MARRLFSPQIVDSDAFLDMPISSQLLYFHLGMRADDDGFVNPKKIMRLIGVGADDLKVLLAKRFVLTFESGVIVIKHWLIHNTIRKDRYNETVYLEEKAMLRIKDNGAYTEINGWQPTGNQLATTRHTQVKVSKVKLSKGNELPSTQKPEEIKEESIGEIPRKFLELKQPKFTNILTQEFPHIDVPESIERFLNWIAKTGANPSRKKPIDWFRKWLAEDQAELKDPKRYRGKEKPVIKMVY